ncbi:hypothetical protein M885DRAFT_614626 [Pelagophyceae sp. CCMP2097]|nr:hypothetical protein M885DRAFT_614626 [Pelagophyceae sp. CCMP2097]|mmetsp:Transcript_26362/g.90650  ORF Transcript_26362/g.90650 Transcript_26362/m.90650 type:complete len:313 (-) Transcript_26362:574-1512(-)
MVRAVLLHLLVGGVLALRAAGGISGANFAALSPAATALQLSEWLGPGVVEGCVEARASPECGGGLGVFSTRALEPGERLATVPLHKCIHAAAAAADPAIGQRCAALLRESALSHGDGPTRGAERLCTAAMLAHVAFGDADANRDAADKWGPYVASLPWALSDAADAADVAAVSGLACVAPHQASAALALVRSRGLGLSRRVSGLGEFEPRHLIVPFLDLFNHPSVSALNAYGANGFFATSLPLSDSCVQWHVTEDGGAVSVDAPEGAQTPCFCELWVWYTGTLPHEWTEESTTEFVRQYGFDPFSKTQAPLT